MISRHRDYFEARALLCTSAHESKKFKVNGNELKNIQTIKNEC